MAAAPVQAQSVCYYNKRARVVQTVEPRCKDGSLIFYSIDALYDVSCGVSNTFNLFGNLCADPCKSALKGIKNYPKTKKKIVVFGPSLLPLEKTNNAKWAFAEYDGSCGDLRDSLGQKGDPKLEPITDDDLIKAADAK
jgi:hypothetical protein